MFAKAHRIGSGHRTLEEQRLIQLIQRLHDFAPGAAHGKIRQFGGG